MVWKIIWLLISSFLIFVTVWSLSIIIRQKSVWKEYAEKNKMKFNPNGFFSTPEIIGKINGYKLHLFASSIENDDYKKKKFRTVIEVEFETSLSADAIIASGDLVSISEYVGLPNRIDINYAGFNDDIVVTTMDKDIFSDYLTNDRLKVINDMSNMKKSGILFLYNDDRLVFQIHTPEALDDIRKIELIVSKLTNAVNILRV